MKTKLEVMLRHRPTLEEDISSQHESFLSKQSAISPPWAIPVDGSLETQPITGRLASIVDLSGILGEGLTGEIVYNFRGKDFLRDEAKFDDYYAVKFSPNKINYRNLATSVFPKLVEAFECYYATINNITLASADWDSVVADASKTGRRTNFRDTVLRINSVNFWDRELCKRAFRLTPADIVKRLAGEVEFVSEFYGGVLLIVTSQILTTEEHEAIDGRIRKLLQHKLFGFF